MLLLLACSYESHGFKLYATPACLNPLPCLQVAMETAVLQQLQHDSLLSYVFLVDEGIRFSVVMDWAGQGLRELVQEQQQQQVSEDIARHITFQLTNSLVYLQTMVSIEHSAMFLQRSTHQNLSPPTCRSGC